MLSFKRPSHKIVIISFLALASFYIGFNLFRFINFYKLITADVVNHKSAISKSLASGSFEIIAEGEVFKIYEPDLKNWTETYIRTYNGQEDIRLKPEQIKANLDAIGEVVSTEPVNAKLAFQNSRAEIFVPAVKGRKINAEKSLANIFEAVFEGHSSASIEFDYKEPEITLDKINSLGIDTLIGRGESDFSGSPLSRIHNIKVGIGKFNGTIIKPGENFSFNDILGEVDEKDGYQSELVIKNGELFYEYGGGLCQVSTTIFRAAINSGLPILERKPHSFPVRYYNPQGFDSTIYPGVVDLRFKNDTANHVLIQGKVVKNKLVVEIYGSSDGRKVSIEGPFQYDQQPNGAMKAYFIRNIAYGDEIKKERFDSNYRPPPTTKAERNPLE